MCKWRAQVIVTTGISIRVITCAKYRLTRVLWPPILKYVSVCTLSYFTCFTRFGKLFPPCFQICISKTATGLWLAISACLRP
jgi:hypothetical protein